MITALSYLVCCGRGLMSKECIAMSQLKVAGCFGGFMGLYRQNRQIAWSKTDTCYFVDTYTDTHWWPFSKWTVSSQGIINLCLSFPLLLKLITHIKLNFNPNTYVVWTNLQFCTCRCVFFFLWKIKGDIFPCNYNSVIIAYKLQKWLELTMKSLKKQIIWIVCYVYCYISHTIASYEISTKRFTDFFFYKLCCLSQMICTSICGEEKCSLKYCKYFFSYNC